MNLDKSTKIQELKEIIKKFRDERDWKQFHDPKNLAEAIAIEVGELQQKFLWKDVKEVKKEMENLEFFNEVEEEFADVIIFCLNFANATGIDISRTVKNKIKKNSKKYPIGKARGIAVKYDKL